MRKVKTILLLLLAAVVLAAGGLLPMAAARIQDWTTADVVHYENIEALQLKLEEEESGMSFFEKLYLMVNGTGMEVTEDVTRMYEEEAIEAAFAALQPYMDIYGLPLDNDELQCFPYMIYDESDPTKLNYYWQVYISLDVSQNDEITVILDDETGKLIAAELRDWDMEITAGYLQELQSAVSAAYLGELELEPLDQWQVDVSSVYTEYESREPPAVIRYQFIDVRYGEINIEIGAHSNGFYILPC